LILNYVTWESIEEIKKMDNEHWLGKFVTAEILLRLIEKGWDIKKIKNGI
jgi:hypothetical protein